MLVPRDTGIGVVNARESFDQYAGGNSTGHEKPTTPQVGDVCTKTDNTGRPGSGPARDRVRPTTTKGETHDKDNALRRALQETRLSLPTPRLSPRLARRTTNRSKSRHRAM